MKSCSFFGHRDTKQTDELKEKVRKIVERFIVEEGVDTFLFGSRSKFDELCHIVVTELQKTHPNIRRVVYVCKHENACLVGAGTSLTRQIEEITGRKERVLEYEEIKKSDRIDAAGRACYVERNYWMADESDFAVFYYDEQKKSPSVGVRLVWEYIEKKQNKKPVAFNVK